MNARVIDVASVRPATAKPLLQRKCACGRAVGLQGECESCSRKKMLGLQPRLAVGRSDDPLEREADEVARRVLAQPPQLQTSGLSEPEFAADTAANVLRRLSHAPGPGAGMVPASVERTLASPGQPLDPALRRDMESRFRVDFAQIRVHADGQAAHSAREVSALAYTVGPHIAFDQGRFAPETASGRELLAHELAHVVQQAGSAQPALMMRESFNAPVGVCRRERQSRRFEIENGGLRVVLATEPAESSVPGCRDFPFSVSLARSRDWWPDKEIGTCESQSGGIRVFQFANIPRGTYYLRFWRTFDHPYCCLRGHVVVFDEAQSGDGDGCKKDSDLSTLEIVHAALDLAGFVPVLGVLADGINAGIYVVEGDWVNVGLSAVAALPLVGDGIKAATMGGKAVIKVGPRTAVKLGEEGLAKELKGLKARSKAEAKMGRTADDAAREAADAKAWDETFKGSKAEGAYETTTQLKRGFYGENLATHALAADGHEVLNFKPDIRGTNQGGIDAVTIKDGFVYFVDNKALTRSGNVSSVSALTTNFTKNKVAALDQMRQSLKSAPTKGEREVWQSAIEAVESGRFKKVVTNANLTRDDAVLSGVTQRLSDQGVEFIDVFKLLESK